jgi:hypothetical protein
MFVECKINIDIYHFKPCSRPTAGVTGKGGNWRTKPPAAESAVGADSPKVWANARTCPVHAVLGSFYPFESYLPRCNYYFCLASI